MIPAQRDPGEHTDPLARLRRTVAALAPLHAALTQAVIDRFDRAGRGAGTPIPLAAGVHDFLNHPDHLGFPGMTASIVSMARVSRLALGDGGTLEPVCAAAVPGAVGYVGAQLDRLVDATAWCEEAAGEVACLADAVLSRIDVSRVRLDWEQGVKAAWRRMDEIAASGWSDGTVEEVELLTRALAESYIDFEGRLFDSVEARFAAAAGSAAGWSAYVTGEARRLVGQATAMLGLAEHSSAGLVVCPWCEQAIGLSRFDPDLACCSGCGRTWAVSDGSAERFFGAWRRAGWVPRRWRDQEHADA